MLMVGWLRHKHSVSTLSSFHKVMRSHVFHDLCAWVDLRVKFLLKLPRHLNQSANGLRETRCYYKLPN